MAMKYHGTLGTLKRLLSKHDLVGSWEKQHNGVHMMRLADGANLHWASGSKTIWFDGKAGARRTLMSAVGCILHELDDGGGPG